ncbi:lipid droplet-associated hydrolase [Nasonia vitripennis]|uniref:Lipid droplet-associated hydrolase n=1 Tax=Nasonia vitripennis TaxID=7425 RepID=A0A7M7QSA3_NASVI|nr:lipid droplet-associated hydrolase [Nasonia vitripennis]XP_031777786.1 lipid droplet-associated hydrolase [Nasonia vitripennis]XP_031777787.1 lipid droplet-associated hydrolase [Nasonia vitripennis]XP_032452043.1 lipid droplet-associated hydrolase [Nasonia vitripennis]
MCLVSEKTQKMHRATVKINEIPTEIITYNRWIEEGIAVGGRKDVVIVITGNPGVPDFYKGFAEQLQAKLPSEVPIWIIGHTGHTKTPDNLPNCYPDTKPARHLYDLKGNLKHKIEFIKQYVPADARIHIIAHSIGSWFTINLLRETEIADRVVKCYLLFPTIERMAESPTGRFLTGIVLRIAAVIIFLSWIFTLLPYLLQVVLIRVFGLFYGIPAHQTGAVLQLVHPIPLKRIFLLAKDEMILVKELDDNLISQHKRKLFLYYGANDGWTPIRYYEDLKAKFPDIDAHLCRRGFQHSFVLKVEHSVEIGKMIGNLISESISSLG